jgi:hypothetical protein
MSEFLSETEGCDLLARLFKARGFAIERNVLFREYGVEFHVDGWDPKARVGFEFLTSEDDDHDDLTVEEYQTLATAQQKGELSLFILDEVEPLSAKDLAASAHEFLDEVAEAVQARRTGAVMKKRASHKKAAVKKATAKKAPKKKAPTQKKAVAKKKPAAKQKVAAKKKVGKKAAVRKGRTKR